MKDYLKEIKKGNTQKFIHIVNKYINDIYGNVITKYSNEEALAISKNIIMNLYIDITKKYMWQNPEKFITKSFERSFKKYSLNIELEAQEIVAPPQVLKEVMVELSRSLKRRGFIGSTVKIASFIAVLVIVCGVITAITIELSKPKKGQTLFRGHNKPLLINEERHFQEYFSFSRTSHNSSMINLNNTGVALEIVKEKERIIKIYDEGDLIKELKVDFNSKLLAGDIDNNYLVFKIDNSIFKSDLDGIESSRIELGEGFLQYVQHHNYLVMRSTKNALIIDLVNFNVINEHSNDILGVTFDGEVLSNKNYLYKQNLNQDDIIKDKLLKDGSIVTLFNDGTVLRYNENSLLWRSSLTAENNIEIENINRGYILETTDKVHIVIYYGGYCYFQSYNDEGEILLNLKDTQKKYDKNIGGFVQPESSYNNDYLLVYNVLNRFDNHIYVIDTKSVPMREMEIQNDNYNKLLLEKGKESSYLYANSSNEIDIYEIKNK